MQTKNVSIHEYYQINFYLTLKNNWQWSWYESKLLSFRINLVSFSQQL